MWFFSKITTSHIIYKNKTGFYNLNCLIDYLSNNLIFYILYFVALPLPDTFTYPLLCNNLSKRNVLSFV